MPVKMAAASTQWAPTAATADLATHQPSLALPALVSKTQIFTTIALETKCMFDDELKK